MERLNGSDFVAVSHVNSLQTAKKRIKLNSMVNPNSVYYRIFDETREDDDYEETIQCKFAPEVPDLKSIIEPQHFIYARNESENISCKNLPKFEEIFDGCLDPPPRMNLYMNSKQSLLSSTPFTNSNKRTFGHLKGLSEKRAYQNLLNNAAKNSIPYGFNPTSEALAPSVNNDAGSRRSSILQQCNFSPIIPASLRHSDAQMRRISATKDPSSLLVKYNQIVENTDKSIVATKIDNTITNTNTTTNNSAIVKPDSELNDSVRLWLHNCTQTPYLSDSWIRNLKVQSGDSVQKFKQQQLEKELHLAEANISFWEKQRILAEKERISNLEQRLACLLRTPPILNDPYLVPQPIPIELPHKPAKRTYLKTLNESQLAQIESVLTSSKPNQVLADEFRLSVTQRELMTLTGLNWLSDMVINFYFQLLLKRSQDQRKRNLPRLAVLSTFFYAKLTAPVGGGYASVQRWTRQMKLFEQDLILVPIHDRGMHWCLASIDLRSKTITYYDSMGSKNTKCLNTLLDYLKQESLNKTGVELENSHLWKLVNTEDTVPQQLNGSDCGVFMCTYGDFLSRDLPFNFSQDDMPDIRKRMIHEILNKKLLST